MRLQKAIAVAGIASRRAAEEMIANGEVTVNGRLIIELGARADPERDHIKVRGKLINPRISNREKRYFLLNKPKGYLSSASDPRGRPLVGSLIGPSARRGLHPVGRLDFNTEGLIILTSDGDLTRAITQAGKVPKVYHVKVKGSPPDAQIQRLRVGIALGGSRTAPAEIKLMEHTREAGNSWYEVTLREGKNQQIRRMFDAIGHSVTKLYRVSIGPLTAKGLAVGEYRELTKPEIDKLLRAASATAASLPAGLNHRRKYAGKRRAANPVQTSRKGSGREGGKAERARTPGNPAAPQTTGGAQRSDEGRNKSGSRRPSH